MLGEILLMLLFLGLIAIAFGSIFYSDYAGRPKRQR
jgi:hypothetical protein